jgi:hypothetical protein
MRSGVTGGQPTTLLGVSQILNRWLRVGEDIIYILAGLVLVGTALVVLVDAGISLATGEGDTVKKIVESTLDSLLLGFILVELLGAVRETMSLRKLVASPSCSSG